MAISKETYNHELNYLAKIVENWDAHADSKHIFDCFLKKLIASGWQNDDIYSLLMDIDSEGVFTASGDASDYIDDAVTALRGQR